MLKFDVLGIYNTLLIVPQNDFLQLQTNEVAGNVKEFIFLDKFYPANKSFSENSNLFPQKWKNLEQKIVKMVSINCPPYHFWDQREENDGSFQDLKSNRTFTLDAQGTEGLLVIDIAKKFNISIHVLIEDDWGEINPKEKSWGVMGAIANGDVDFGLAGMYLWYPEAWHITISSVIQMSSVSIFVPKPKFV